MSATINSLINENISATNLFHNLANTYQRLKEEFAKVLTSESIEKLHTLYLRACSDCKNCETQIIGIKNCLDLLEDPIIIDVKTIHQIIDSSNIFRGYQTEIKNIFIQVLDMPCSRFLSLYEDMVSLRSSKPTWVYQTTLPPFEEAKLKSITYEMLKSWQLKVASQTEYNFLLLINFIAKMDLQNIQSILLKEVEYELTLNTAYSISRFEDDLKTAMKIYEVVTPWKESKEAAQSYVDFAAQDILDNGNFDHLMWEPLTKSCMTGVCNALMEKINLKKFLSCDASNLENIAEMIINSTIESSASQAFMGVLFKIRTGCARSDEKHYFDKIVKDSSLKRDTFISIFENHPDVVKNGHSGSSMYFICNEWIYILINGWKKYLQLRYENLGIKMFQSQL